MFFMNLTACNLAIAVIVLCLLLFKKLFGRYLNPACHYYLWAAVLAAPIGLLLPIRLPRILSPDTFITGVVSADGAPSQIQASAIAAGDFFESAGTSVNKISSIMLLIWLAGIAAGLTLFIIGALKLRRIRRTSVKADPFLTAQFDLCSKRAGLKHAVDLRISRHMDSPAAAGLLHTAVYFPADALNGSFLNQDGQSCVLIHELIHIKHHDIFMNYMLYLCRTLLWFNPAVHLACKRLLLDREIYRDALVMRLLSSRERFAYGYTLLAFAGVRTASPSAPYARISGAKAQLKRRLLAITAFNGRPLKLRYRFLTAAIAASVLFIGLPAGAVFAAQNTAPAPHAVSDAELLDLSAYFNGCQGAFVMLDEGSGRTFIYNPALANKRTAPDSTFKIYSALYALESGTISPNSSRMDWDGTVWPFGAWNKDQTLKSAMEGSVNWYFRNLDARSGSAALSRFYESIGYGNADLSSGIDNYWQEGSLKISPAEQVDLLYKFNHKALGCSAAATDTVKDAILLYSDSKYRLYGKTGTGGEENKSIRGWFVGFLEAGQNTLYFAVQITPDTADSEASGSQAAQIAFSILKALPKQGGID